MDPIPQTIELRAINYFLLEAQGVNDKDLLANSVALIKFVMGKAKNFPSSKNEFSDSSPRTRGATWFGFVVVIMTQRWS